MKEKDYYDVIKTELGKLFKDKEKEVYLEITANRFNNKLKEQIPDNRNIIFSFLGTKGARPDITGFIQKEYSKDFIVIEIKNKKIKLDDIYQLRKYADLFEAKFAFLVSTEEIPAEIKALLRVPLMFILWRIQKFPQLTLVHFNKNTKEFVDWFEENPFEKEYYWK